VVEVLWHDPELAHRVYDAYARLAGRAPTQGAYSKWLRDYVDPIARELGYVIVDEHRIRGWLSALSARKARG
jgi:hypothetical protein